MGLISPYCGPAASVCAALLEAGGTRTLLRSPYPVPANPNPAEVPPILSGIRALSAERAWRVPERFAPGVCRGS